MTDFTRDDANVFRDTQKTARVVIPHGYSVTRVVMLCIGDSDSDA